MDLDPPITPLSDIPFPSSTFCLALSFALTGELDSTFEGFANFGTEQEKVISEIITIKINYVFIGIFKKKCFINLNFNKYFFNCCIFTTKIGIDINQI